MNLYATCCEPAASSLAVTQYPPIAPNRNQVVRLLPHPGHLVGRAQIMPSGTPNQILKAKQPQQILPKPIPPGGSPQKQSVPRLNTAMPQQTPLLINQPQTQSPTLLLNQVLTSGAPVIVQPAGPGGTVHLMLRTPTPTLQSGPGPPQNKMIIANPTQPQPQATVLIQNRQQVVRFMTAQGPMQLQQIQTPSGPQFIAIPQNQSLSFPPNSVLVPSPAAGALQLQQNSGSSLQLRQSPSAILHPNSFSQNPLQNQISLQNHILQASATPAAAGGLKRDEKSGGTDHANGLPGANEQKKIVIDNKSNNKKNASTANSNLNNVFNNGNGSNNASNTSNLNNALAGAGSSTSKKNNKASKKSEEEPSVKSGSKTYGKAESTPVSTSSSTAQKNLTSSLRQVRPGAFANRNKQNVNSEAKEKAEDANARSLSNLAKIIDSVASNTEHLNSPPPPKVDNLTATINSVAENVKSPTPDDIMSNLSLNDVFIPGSKSLNLNKRPNLTIVQKHKPEQEEPNLPMSRLILSPSRGPPVDFEGIPENYDALELGGITTAVQTTGTQSFGLDQNGPNPGAFQSQQSQDDGKKGKKKPCNKKKGKKEENRVDLWDLMKSAGIGDDEFDETSDMMSFSQDTATVTESIEIAAASDSDLLAQIQAATQVPGGLRVVVGEDGRPVIINGSNVLIPDPVSGNTSQTSGDSTDADAVLQNMLLPDNVLNFTPQSFATAQTQLNQLIQDHGGLATSSSDQQLLSQIFGATPTSISSSTTSATTSTNSTTVQSSAPSSIPGVQSQSLPSSSEDTMLVKVGPSSNKISQSAVVQSKETKSELIRGPPPGLSSVATDTVVIANNNGIPTLVASPAVLHYIQNNQGILQFQQDPVTKALVPSLVFHPPHHKVEPPLASSQDGGRTDKSIATVISSNVRISGSPNKEPIKPRSDAKTSVGTVTDDPKVNPNNALNVAALNQSVSNVLKVNMVKLVKDNPSLLQIANETNNLIACKEGNKNLSEKERTEIEKKILQNRALLDQCVLIESNRGGLSKMDGVPNLIVKEGGSKEMVAYQIGGFGTDKATTETQTLEDLQNLDMTLIKGFHPAPNTNSPTPTSDFQAKFLESIGMANKVPPKVTVSVGTGTSSPSTGTPAGGQTASLKKARKKKDKSQNQAIQADVKTEAPSVTFNIPELTPEQNVKLNQALQSRGAVFNQLDNLEAIKQIIHEEVRKLTSTAIQTANIRITNTSSLPADDHQSASDQSIPATNMVLSNPNLNQLLEQGPTGHGNVISLQGNDVLAINSGNQPIFSSPNQILSGNHFVSSSNQILAIGGSHNQLVSLGNPINSSNQIVTLGSPPSLMSMSGNNVASPGAVIVGNSGNVVAILHQSPTSGQGPGIVQRIQAIQLTSPKQQHLKSIQTQIQTLSSKANRTPTEQSTLQKLIAEQQKILSSGKIVTAVPGQQVQGMQIVSPSIAATGKVYQAQSASQQQQQQSQLSQGQSLQGSQSQQQQQQPPQAFIATASGLGSQPSKFSSQNVVSCGTNTLDLNSSFQHGIPKITVPPTVLISDVPTSNYGPLYVSPNNSNKNVTKCEKGTSPIQIQMGTQTVTNLEYRSGKMSTGTMTSPNTGKPQAVVAPAIVIQQTESQSPTYQMKPRNQANLSEPVRTQTPALNRIAFIEQQMRTDQAGATMPDTRTPFLSKSDAVKRLIRYHVMEEKALSPQDLATADDIFEATAQHLLDKFRAMKEKYKYLLMLESMREVSTAERIMVDRNFIIEERMELEELREKEKRLKEEFESATITRPCNNDSSFIKTEYMLDELKAGISEINESKTIIKVENAEEQEHTMISKNRISDINSDLIKDSSFKLTESNRNVDLVKIKSETKECKNTRTPTSGRSRSESPRDEDFPNISGKCKAKSCRTFSDGSSKSSLDSSRDEDSGTDINAQVQSAIDSILNLQKCDTLSEPVEEGATAAGKRAKKKRKLTEKIPESSKRLKIKGFGGRREERSQSEESEDDDEDCVASNADPILDEAIRSILSS